MSQVLKKVNNYKFVKKIGTGATSDVYQGRKEGEIERYAIKMIKSKALNKEQIEMISKEVTIIKNINHPNIVKLYQALMTHNHYYLVFQFCQKGDLEKYLKENLGSLLQLHMVRNIIKCIAEAVQHLHSMGIAHRDIKLANILIKKDFTIKLADFGFAKETNSEEDILMKTYCGTPITMAPEILKGKPYDKKCDIWSLGVILFQLVFGKLPFPINQGYSVFIEKVTTEKVNIPASPQIPSSLKQLIYACLEINQEKRYSIDDFLSSQWMQEPMPEESVHELKQSVNQILKKVNKPKNAQHQKQGGEDSKNVMTFQWLLAKRISRHISAEVDKILKRHESLRKEIIRLSQENKQILQALYYYDYLMLQKWKIKQVKIRRAGYQQVFFPLTALDSLTFPKPLMQQQGEAIQIFTVLQNYLRKLSTMDIQLEHKKNRYHLLMTFLDFIQNFELEITLIFNDNYELQFSLEHLTGMIENSKEEQVKEREYQKREYHKGLNHITIALQCKEKDEKFRQAANSLKVNCQKRIDDIQREINGYYK